MTPWLLILAVATATEEPQQSHRSALVTSTRLRLLQSILQPHFPWGISLTRSFALPPTALFPCKLPEDRDLSWGSATGQREEAKGWRNVERQTRTRDTLQSY